jgi:hypothetical protein
MVLLNCPERELFRDRCAVLRAEPRSRFQRSLFAANADYWSGKRPLGHHAEIRAPFASVVFTHTWT